MNAVVNVFHVTEIISVHLVQKANQLRISAVEVNNYIMK